MGSVHGESINDPYCWLNLSPSLPGGMQKGYVKEHVCVCVSAKMKVWLKAPEKKNQGL